MLGVGSMPGLTLAFVEAGQINWSALSPTGEASVVPPAQYGAGERIPFATYEAGTELTMENIGTASASVLILAVTPAVV